MWYGKSMVKVHALIPNISWFKSGEELCLIKEDYWFYVLAMEEIGVERALSFPIGFICHDLEINAISSYRSSTSSHRQKQGVSRFDKNQWSTIIQ